MIESLIEATFLPNLHPVAVHFPLAFFPLALAFEIAGLAFRRQVWLAPAATTLYVLSALGAWFAVWAGERAADGLVDVPATVQLHIGTHSDWAHRALYAVGLLAALRLIVHLTPKWTGHRGARAVLALIGLAALGLLVRAADLGGGLVFEHAVAVRQPVGPTAQEEPLPSASAAPSGSATPAAERLVATSDGKLIWQPNTDDRDALGQVVTAGPGTSLDAVRFVPSAEGDGGAGAGLTLEVDGTAMLLLPSTFSDVQVEATLVLDGYVGSAGLVHHMTPAGDGGFFILGTEGQAILSNVRGDGRNVLDQAATALPETLFSLAVSAAGRHLKGLLDGETVVHGHVAPGPAGRCGLLLDGSGTVRVLRVAAIPLESH